MNESKIEEFSQKKLKPCLIYSGFSTVLMGILSSCTIEKPISIDTLTRYPSPGEMIKKPFYPGANQDIRNLSHFYLQSAEDQTEYVDDNGIVVSEADLEPSNQ